MIDKSILKVMLSEDEIILLARANEVGAVKVIMKVVTQLRDRDRFMNESHPRRDDSDIKHDWVYVAGGISRLNDVLLLPQTAAELIK